MYLVIEKYKIIVKYCQFVFVKYCIQRHIHIKTYTSYILIHLTHLKCIIYELIQRGRSVVLEFETRTYDTVLFSNLKKMCTTSFDFDFKVRS